MINQFVSNILRWVIHTIGKRTLLLLLLLLVILGSTSMGLAETVRSLELALAFTVGSVGVFFGWWLARTRTSGRAAVIITSLLGAGLLAYRLGQLGGPALQAWRAITGLIGEGLPWQLDWTPVLGALGEILSVCYILLSRLVSWGVGIVMGQTAFDPLAINLAWGLAIWWAAVWASWWTRRKRSPLLGIIPAGLLLAAPLNFTNGNFAYLIPVIGSTSLLLTFLHHDDRERHWDKNKIDYSEEIRFDLYISGVVIALVLGVLTSAVPSIPFDKISQAFNRSAPRGISSQPEGRAQSLGLERGFSPGGNLTSLIQAGLPRDHLLGSGPELSEQVVMWIETGELAPVPDQEILDQPVPRYYWRGLTYDQYKGRGWSSSPTTEVQRQADQILPPVDAPEPFEAPPGQRLVQQRVQFADSLEQTERLLYVAGSLLSSNHAYRVALRAQLDESEKSPENDIEPLPIDILGATLQANQYNARSLVTEASLNQLDNAGSDYPDWIMQRYLSLPDSVPQRVLSLARDLTATSTAPFEQAKAIETYLREYPYTLDLPPPPVDQDVVDYFLFDLKKGYCDYYASAMVVLARAAGIPARLVVGYASGSYDASASQYIVTEANAHSWPELYFPDIGWVEFEPTAGLPAIERQQNAYQAELPARDLTASPTRGWGLVISSPTWILWVIGGLSTLVIAMALSVTIDQWRLKQAEPRETVRNLYRRFSRRSARFVEETDPGTTPDELAQAFEQAIAPLLGRNPLGRVFTPAGDQARLITLLYNQATFSSRLPDQDDQTQAIAIWRRLRWKVWLLPLTRSWLRRLRGHSE